MWNRERSCAAAVVLFLAALADAQEKPAGDRAAAGPHAFTVVTRATIPGRPGVVDESRVRFSGRYAAMFDSTDDGLVVYDLEKKQWFDWVRGGWTTLKEAEDWARASKERTVASAEKEGVDEEVKKFLLPQLDPKFKVEPTERGVTLVNDVFTYDLTTKPLPKEYAGPFATQQRLGAYMQAIAERKLPPFPLLDVLRELEKRGAYAETMDLTVRAKGREQKLTLSVSIEPADADQKERVAAVLKEAADQIAKAKRPAGEADAAGAGVKGRAAKPAQEKDAPPF